MKLPGVGRQKDLKMLWSFLAIHVVSGKFSLDASYCNGISPKIILLT